MPLQTAQILELLAARRSGRPAAPVQELLTRCQGGDATTLQDTLARLAQSNPMLGLIAQQWAGSAAAVPNAQLVAEEAVELEQLPPASGCDADLEPTGEPLADAAGLAGELGLLRERVDRCAAALGACGMCWGRDSGCRACRGRGRPGFAVPDDALFDELIMPAVRMMKTHRTRPALPATATAGTPSVERSAPIDTFSTIT